MAISIGFLPLNSSGFGWAEIVWNLLLPVATATGDGSGRAG